jgi:hypothetical protein
VSIIIRNCASGSSGDAFSAPPHVLPDCVNSEARGPYRFSFIIDWTLLSSMDSDLEAFSHYPADGSFTALAVQPTVLTNYLIQLFLSY